MDLIAAVHFIKRHKKEEDVFWSPYFGPCCVTNVTCDKVYIRSKGNSGDSIVLDANLKCYQEGEQMLFLADKNESFLSLIEKLSIGKVVAHRKLEEREYKIGIYLGEGEVYEDIFSYNKESVMNNSCIKQVDIIVPIDLFDLEEEGNNFEFNLKVAHIASTGRRH